MDVSTIACLKLLDSIDCNRYADHPYCRPFINYVMQWPHHLPINTIIIGQNPYPGNIFHELGAALSYDESKVSTTPNSVRVLAEDLYNYDETPRQQTIGCFRDSWRMLEHGILMINETVFHKIAKDTDRPNTGVLREVESQVITIQTLLSEGIKMGQKSVTLIGMGMGASMMTSIIRPWCPADLISTKVMTCSNPAAFSSMLSDSSSQRVTLGQSNVSKVLSNIVKLYVKMPPRVSTADKRRQQSTDTLNRALEEAKNSSHVNNNELRSFKDRLTQLDPSNPKKADIEDLKSSIDALTKANDRHANAISVHSMSMLALMDIATKEYPKASDKYADTQPSRNTQSLAIPSTPSPGPRRRVVRRSTSATPQVDPIPEDNVTDAASEVVSVQSLVNPPTRARRRVVRTPSIAGSEYTVASTIDDVQHSPEYDMTQAQATHMKTFSGWFKDNYKHDPSFEVILASAADSKTVDNPLSKDILDYIKMRKSEDTMYDPYDELSDPDSTSSKWITDYMATHS